MSGKTRRPDLAGEDAEALRTAIVAFIAAYQAEHNGRPPSYREIMRAVGITSTGHMSDTIKVLIAEGRLLRDDGPRSLTVPR